MHCSDFHDFAHSQNIGIVGGVQKRPVIGIDDRDDPVARHEDPEPVLSSIVVGDCHIVPTVFCRGEIAAERTSEQHVGKLRRIDIRRYDTAHHSHQGSPDIVAVPAHLAVSDSVRGSVDVDVGPCAGHCGYSHCKGG